MNQGQPQQVRLQKLKELFQGAALTAEFAKRLWRELWKAVLPWVPFAEAYREKLRIAIGTEAQHGISRFLGLQSIAPERKSDLLSRVASAESRLALVTIYRTRVERTSVSAVILVMLFASAIDGDTRSHTQAWTAWYMFDPLDAIDRLWREMLTAHQDRLFAPGFGFVLLTLLLLSFILNRGREYPALPMFGLSITVLALGLFIYHSYLEVHSPFSDHAVTTVAMVIWGLVSVFFLLLTGAMIGTLFKRWRKKLYPDAIIINGLLTVLHKLEDQREQWHELGFRREIASRLEEVAYSIQSGLPSRLQSGDLVVDTWMKRTTSQQAAAIRGLKKWLAVPKKDTREHLIQAVAGTFTLCAEGDWDGLARQEPETLSRWDHYTRISALLRTVFVAAFPLAALSAYVQLWRPAGEVPGSIQILAILWAAGTVLTTVDPLFGARVTVFKDILDIPFKRSDRR